MNWFKRKKKNDKDIKRTDIFRLSDMKADELAVVKYVCGNGAIRRRIIDMGITPAVEIRVVKLAPLGDPMEISLRGYQLSIRRSEASEIYMADRK